MCRRDTRDEDRHRSRHSRTEPSSPDLLPPVEFVMPHVTSRFQSDESSMKSRAFEKAFGLRFGGSSESSSLLLLESGNEPTVMLPVADWTCSGCGKTNARSALKCFNCRESWDVANHRGKKDWECLKCHFRNYSSSIECFKCKRFRPTSRR